MAAESTELEAYLQGRKFSNALQFNVSGMPRELKFRLELLEEMARGKKVVHLGFADHLSLVEAKRANDTWLHARLARASARCLGLDIDRQAVEEIRQRYGVADVAYCDLEAGPCPEMAGETWDWLILGEILEHLPNPCGFLASLHRNCRSVQRLLITAPNALRAANFVFARQQVECINSEHMYWFTPYTLMKIATQAGFRPEGLWLCESYRPSPLDLERNPDQHRELEEYPLLRDTIVLSTAFADGR